MCVLYILIFNNFNISKSQGPIPIKLQEIELNVIDMDECSKIAEFDIDDTHVCTLMESGKGACFGDSGFSFYFFLTMYFF